MEAGDAFAMRCLWRAPRCSWLVLRRLGRWCGVKRSESYTALWNPAHYVHECLFTPSQLKSLASFLRCSRRIKPPQLWWYNNKLSAGIHKGHPSIFFTVWTRLIIYCGGRTSLTSNQRAVATETQWEVDGKKINQSGISLHAPSPSSPHALASPSYLSVVFTDIVSLWWWLGKHTQTRTHI